MIPHCQKEFVEGVQGVPARNGPVRHGLCVIQHHRTYDKLYAGIHMLQPFRESGSLLCCDLQMQLQQAHATWWLMAPQRFTVALGDAGVAAMGEPYSSLNQCVEVQQQSLQGACSASQLARRVVFQ